MAQVVLRGQHDGDEYAFELGFGEHRVGSSKPSDVRLATAGVSRQHAILTVSSQGIAVEDRGSRNGTFVDDHRVQRAAVPPDAELRFGPVRLRLETRDADESALGLRLPLGMETDPGSATFGATSIDATDSSTAHLGITGQLGPSVELEVLEGFADRLANRLANRLADRPADREDGLGVALAFLVERLGLAGACVLRWIDRGEPVALAVHGRVPKIPSVTQLDDRVGVTRSYTISARPPVDLATHVDGQGDRIGIALLGRESSAPTVDVRLLRLLLHLVRGAGAEVSKMLPSKAEGPGSREPGSRGPESERQQDPMPSTSLRFPAGYRPRVSPAMTALYRQMAALRDDSIPVLVIGETGVGKDRLVRTLHASSTVSDGPLVAINCAAIPAELLEAELFGIGAGVATGVRQRVGLFEKAAGGTLFLDEIGEMPTAFQAKLLRALESNEVQPVGGVSRAIHVRLVAATNAQLADKLRDGSFRSDLYYRLAGFVLEIPPLRDCPEDIPELVAFFLERACATTHARLEGISVKALRSLAAYPWPGNVRELEHEIRRLVLLAVQTKGRRTIDSSMLADRITAFTTQSSQPVAAADEQGLVPRLQAYERQIIASALEQTGGKRAEAAQLLGLHRNGLLKKMKRLGLTT